ncbi:AIPR family protein [Parabacteroides faecis]|uniref:AIPR family protein n=1 Tax=Parabacteroides TaxID=375288 RepID=UPI00094E00D5|nr:MULTISPECIES: AIPR family protein [Parabacteroides]UVQ47730.1 AIPR family protein [Parabacteroides faecis]
MTNEPIINARFKKYCENYGLLKLSENEAFEQFVNSAILIQHQPDAFSADSELIDSVCVGGPGDTGIDGISIKVNGMLVKSIDEIKDIISKSSRLSIEFIFIQSKNKSHFSATEIGAFITGVRNFLSERPMIPLNEKLENAFRIKEYLVSDDITYYWKESPIVRMYYVVMGKWNNDPLHIGTVEQAKKDILNTNICSKVDFYFIDSEYFRNILDSNENKFSIIIDVIDTMGLTSVEGVENSCMVLCSATELYKLITTDEGVIRKSLFDDNVRDYQGENTVNTEILETISESPQKFILLNNGIAIVCDEFIPNNRKLKIENPQIVNGCQTCHVLYKAKESNLDISSITLVIKLIATRNDDIANEIVKGTNRQSIVLEEAFETTKKFHKDLERFFNVYIADFQDKIYYERRTKQYAHNPTIKPIQKINLRILTQYCIGVIKEKPYLSHKHESILLKEFANDIFQESHSKLPYFAVSYAFYTLEKLFREQKIHKDLKAYKAHLLMVFCRLVAGKCPNLLMEKNVDIYADKILKNLYDIKKAHEKFEISAKIFYRSKRFWIDNLNKSKYAIKDIPEFTELLIKDVSDFTNNPVVIQSEVINVYSGKVKKVMKNSAGKYCGYISWATSDIFFQQSKNPGLVFENLENKKVKYCITSPDNKGRVQAINVQIEE